MALDSPGERGRFCLFCLRKATPSAALSGSPVCLFICLLASSVPFWIISWWIAAAGPSDRSFPPAALFGDTRKPLQRDAWLQEGEEGNDLKLFPLWGCQRRYGAAEEFSTELESGPILRRGVISAARTTQGKDWLWVSAAQSRAAARFTSRRACECESAWGQRRSQKWGTRGGWRCKGLW